MSSIFDLLVRKYGTPTLPTRPLAAQLDALAGHLPPDLVAFWQRQGIGLWLDGKFQFCLPSDYAPLVARIFADDPDFAPAATHLVGFSAFGQLLIWNEKYQRLLVDLLDLEALVPALNAREAGDPENFPIATPLSRLDRKGSFDVFEQNNAAEPLFDRARARVGPPKLGECYGFFPALAFGGNASLDRIARVDALTHFTFLADAGRCRLMAVLRSDEDVTLLRHLGPTEHLILS